MILFSLAILTLLLTLAFRVDMAMGPMRLQSLSSIAPKVHQPQPFVSIIVAALNEEESMGEALESWRNLDYDHLEKITAKDRSTDGTGSLLEQQAGLHPKTHVLLFTDADVKLDPSTLKRTLRRMQDKNLDHLTLLFGAELSGGLLNMVVIEFGVYLAAFLKPWKASDLKSSRSN